MISLNIYSWDNDLSQFLLQNMKNVKDDKYLIKRVGEVK